MSLAGSASIAIKPDFTLFNRELSQHLRSIHSTSTIKIDPKLNEAAVHTVNAQLKEQTKPVTKEVHVATNRASMTKAEGEVRGSMGRISTLIKGALGASFAYFGVHQLGAAITSVNALYENSERLHSITGMSLTDSARLVAVANSLGISTRSLGVAFKQLDTQYTAAVGGSKTAFASFKALGISMGDLKSTGGDTEKVFQLVADHLDRVPPSAEKTAAQFKLLGRSALQLNPILLNNGEALKTLTKFAASVGITLGSNTTKNIEAARIASAEFKIAIQAAQLFIVNKLIPAFLDVGKWIKQNVIPPVKEIIHDVTTFVKAHPGIVKIGLAILGVGVAVKKILGPLASAKKLLFGSTGGGLFSGIFPTAAKTSAGATGFGGIFPSAAKITKEATGFTSRLKGVLGKGLRGVGIFAGGEMVTQIAGTLVKGGAKGWVKSIGTGASIGAGIGTALFGPAGGFIGAAVGGLTGAVVHWINSNAAKEGRDWAKKFSAATGGNLNLIPPKDEKQFQDRLAKLYTSLTNKLREKVSHEAIISRFGYTNRDTENIGKVAAALAKVATQRFQAQWANVRFKTPLAFVKDVTAQVAKLPKAARQQGAEQMVSLAAGMESQGKLPKGTTQRVVQSIQNRWGDLFTNLDGGSDKSAKQVADHYKFDQAMKNTRTAITDIMAHWGIAWKGTKTGNKGMSDNFKTTYDFLKYESTHTTGSIKTQSLRDMDYLRKHWKTYLHDMATSTATNMDKISSKIKGGSADAAHTAETNFGNLATATQAALKSGALNAGQAAKIIGDSLNKMLIAFGQAPIPLAGLSAQSLVQWQNWWKQGSASQTTTSVTSSGVVAHRAMGGLVQIGKPGEAGTDSIPLNIGGQDIVVGRGEVAAVFNRHQMADLNRTYAKEGGLAGFFRKRTKPNYAMATGGLIPHAASGWTNVVASAEDDIGKQGAYGIISPFGYSELSNPPSSLNFSALGNLPPHTRMKIKAGAREVVAQKQDVGAGSSFNPQMGLYPGTLAQLGLSGGEFHVSIERADGQPLTIGSIGSGGQLMPHLPPFKGVTGTGTMSKIVQGVANKMIGGANKYIDAHQPVMSFPGPLGAGRHGLTTFEGVTMSKWIADELMWATKHGWHGQPTSGYRPGFDPFAPSGSEHALIDYPGGAVDFGGFNDPAAYATKLALVNLANRLNYQGPRLLMPIGFHDDGHLSGTGHTRGGLLPFGKGGVLKATSGALNLYSGYGSNFVGTPRHHKPSKPKARATLKKMPVFDMSAITADEAAITRLGGWQGFIDSLHGAWGSVQPMVNDASGNSVVNWGSKLGKLGTMSGMIDPDTHRITTGIYDRLREIGALSDPVAFNALSDTELGLAQGLLNDYLKEQMDAAKLYKKLIPWLKTARNKVAEEDWLDKRKKQWTGEESTRTAEIKKRVADAKKSLGPNISASTLLSKQMTGLSQEEQKALNAIPKQKTNDWIGDADSWKKMYEREVGWIKDEFGARKAAVKHVGSSYSGTLSNTVASHVLDREQTSDEAEMKKEFTSKKKDAEAIIKALEARKWKNMYTKVTSDPSLQSQLGDYLDPAGALTQNILTSQMIDIPGLQTEISTLLGTTAPAVSASADAQALLELEKQLNLQLQQALLVSQDQYKTISDFNTQYPYGGSYKDGGFVKGAYPGQSVMIEAHAGEYVIPENATQPNVIVNIHGKGVPLDQFIDARIEKKTGRAARNATRGLAGAGGGGFR